MGLKKELADILACSKCKGEVKEKEMFIVCENCKLAYPLLEGGTPDMLVENAWELEKAEKSNFAHTAKKID